MYYVCICIYIYIYILLRRTDRRELAARRTAANQGGGGRGEGTVKTTA